MGFIDDLKQQLYSAQQAVKRLTSNKESNEKKRREGERLQEDFKSLRKKLNSAVSTLEENVRARTENTPGNFGKYYREQIDQGLKAGKIKELDGQASGILSSFVSKILDLDDIIEDLIRQISEQNSAIQYLKNKLRELGEFVEDLIPGGD